MEPIRRSAYGFCHGLWGAARISSMRSDEIRDEQTNLSFANNGSGYRLLCCNAFISVVESAELWNGNHYAPEERKVPSRASRPISSAEYQSASAVPSGLPAHSHSNSATADVYAGTESTPAGSALLSGESKSC